jgi:hypothetical protein
MNVKACVVSVVLLCTLLVISGCSGVSSMTAGKMEWIQPESDAPRAGNAYLIRGWIGFFSAGIDSLGVKINESGVRACIYQQNQTRLTARTLAKVYGQSGENREPIILIGHSLGADDAIKCARELQKAGVQVDMLITMDPTLPPKVPTNVKVCYNYYQPSIFDATGILRGVALQTDPGFTGELHNMNIRKEYKHLLEPDTNHVNIDKNSKIHADILERLKPLCVPREQWVAARGARLAKSTIPPARQTTPHAGGNGNGAEPDTSLLSPGR